MAEHTLQSIAFLVPDADQIAQFANCANVAQKHRGGGKRRARNQMEFSVRRVLLGFAFAFMIGAVFRIIRIPSPAPQALLGSLLVVTVTLGYIAAVAGSQIKGLVSLWHNP